MNCQTQEARSGSLMETDEKYDCTDICIMSWSWWDRESVSRLYPIFS